MLPVTTRTFALALLAAALAGCGQYRGYTVLGTDEVSRETRLLERGAPGHIEAAVTCTAAAAGLVRVKVTRPSDDEVAQVLVTEERRLKRYSDYFWDSDVLGEPGMWFLGPFVGVAGVIHEHDWHELCFWPPVDLLARLLGSDGFRDADGWALPYAEHPPCYPLRLVQWAAWALPGYSFGRSKADATRDVEKRLRRVRVGPRRLERRAWPVAGAAVSLRTSAAPRRVLRAATNAYGRADFFLTQPLIDAPAGQRVTVRVVVEFDGQTACVEQPIDGNTSTK